MTHNPSSPSRSPALLSGPTGGPLLYHGVGRGEVGATALGRLGPVTRYDPVHPDPVVRHRKEAFRPKN